ncbi:unnamed protein product [Moneuplotes crassus]|uniref:Uncharacterized protein n=1 Tax=Euplotes crassus TaxID=5936 RepID=A0AAD2DA09_EUPCR|nr:unnamed protein product [Moneuplotes crassus]
MFFPNPHYCAEERRPNYTTDYVKVKRGEDVQTYELGQRQEIVELRTLRRNISY